KIKNDMRNVDFNLEKRVVRLKHELDDHALAKLDRNNLNQQEKELLSEYEQLEKDMAIALERLAAHRWMQPIFNEFNGMEALTKPNNLLAEFMQETKAGSFNLYTADQDVKKINLYLETKMIDFYYKKSLHIIEPENFELRYINIKE